MEKKSIILIALILIFPLGYSIKEIIIDETEKVAIVPKAIDPDNDKLIIEYSDPLNKSGEWQTNYGDAGTYITTIKVSDGELSDTEEVKLTVLKKEENPKIDSFSPKEDKLIVDEGKKLEFSVNASDLNNDPLSYEWKVDKKTAEKGKVFTYKPSFEDAGNHTTEIVISDGKSFARHQWNVIVNDFDRKILLNQIANIEVEENQEVSLKLPNLSDYNLRYEISEPIGDDNYWKTSYDDAGNYKVKVTVKDLKFEASKIINVVVKNIDRNPVFKAIKKTTINENDKITIDLNVSDPDKEDKIIIKSDNLPEGAKLVGKKFTWTPGYDTIPKKNAWQRFLDSMNMLKTRFDVKFIAQSNDKILEQIAKINVKNMNRAPIFTELKPVIVNEGDVVIIDPKAIDPDNDPVSLSFSGWLNTNRYKTNFDQAGEYVVKVTASDGRLAATQDVKVIIKNVNRAPVFEKILQPQIRENQPLILDLKANDPDGDELTYSSDNLPKGAVIKDNKLYWTPDFNAVRDDKNEFSIPISVSDGKLKTSQDILVEVLNTNRPPEILDIVPKGEIIAYINEPVELKVKAIDKDGDKLSYEWDFSTFEVYDATNSHQRTFTTPGMKRVSVYISDGKDKTFTAFDVTVLEKPVSKTTTPAGYLKYAVEG